MCLRLLRSRLIPKITEARETSTSFSETGSDGRKVLALNRSKLVVSRH